MRILTAALTISLLAAPLSGQALTTDVGIRGITTPQVSLATRIDAALALPLRTMEMRDAGMSDEVIGRLLDEMATFNLPATAQLAVLASARDAAREGRPPLDYVTSARRLQEAGQPVVSQRPDPAHARRHVARQRHSTWGRPR